MRMGHVSEADSSGMGIHIVGRLPPECNRQPYSVHPGRAHPHHHPYPWHPAMVPSQRIVGSGRKDSAGGEVATNPLDIPSELQIVC
jgi:hypothetical protein